MIILVIAAVAIVLTGGLDDTATDVNETNGTHHYEVKIVTNGAWEGSVTSDDVKMESLSGTGNKTLDLGNSDSSNVNVDISKMDDSSKLTVKLYSDGKVVDSDSVDVPNGSVLISA